jgi:hypothetical protein
MGTPNWTEKVGGRKFIVTLYSLLSITALLYLKSIDQETFKAILVAVVLVYISGNVGQKAFIRSSSGATSPPVSATDAAAQETQSVMQAASTINSAITSVSKN